MSLCSNCTAGKVQPLAGQRQCYWCPQGSYAANETHCVADVSGAQSAVVGLNGSSFNATSANPKPVVSRTTEDGGSVVSVGHILLMVGVAMGALFVNYLFEAVYSRIRRFYGGCHQDTSEIQPEPVTRPSAKSSDEIQLQINTGRDNQVQAPQNATFEGFEGWVPPISWPEESDLAEQLAAMGLELPECDQQ